MSKPLPCTAVAWPALVVAGHSLIHQAGPKCHRSGPWPAQLQRVVLHPELSDAEQGSSSHLVNYDAKGYMQPVVRETCPDGRSRH